MIKNVSKFLVGDLIDDLDMQRYRQGILVGHLALLIIVICIILLLFDTYYQLYDSLWSYIPLILVGILIIFINRAGNRKFAKHLLLLSSFFVTYIFGARESFGTGAYLMFYPLLISAFALFSFEQIGIKIFYTVLAILLFYLIHFTDFTLFSKTQFPKEKIYLNLAVNYTLSIMAMVFIVHFLLSLYVAANEVIVNKENSMRDLSMQLRKSEHRYQLAIQGSNAGIWEYDIQKGRISLTPKWKEITGLEIDQDYYTYEFVKKLVHPEDLEMVESSLNDHLQHKQTYQVEYRLLHNNGNYVWVSDSGQAEWGKNDKPKRMVGSISDVTGRKKAEELLIEQNNLLVKTNEELDRFVYSASHDLRAPLMSILGLINLLEKERSGLDTDTYIKLIRESIQNLDDFIAEIIEYSRNERLKPDPKQVNVNQLMQSCLKSLYYIPKIQKIQIENTVDLDLEVIVDEYRLRIVLKNLISNAIKYHSDQKTNPFVKIEARIENNDLKVMITDNGLGIASDVQPHIFDMFYRGTEKSKGSGLGLYICKEMLTKIDGDVWFESELDVGSTFYIKIPVVLS